MAEPEAREIWVSGRVQGVSFRAFTQSVAQDLGLSGYCENLPDGRVHIQVEGSPANLAKFIEQVRKGPRGSRVADFSVSAIPTTGGRSGFGIRR